MMPWKCWTQYAGKFGKLSSGHRTGKGQFSFQSQRNTMPKNAQTMAQFNFLDSKITADGDCSQEIKRCLLVGRKVMTNLDSILKGRDISLP